jgi:hypothetical protein
VGAQYAFGLRDIAGERYNQAGPGVFVSGPFHLDGMPEIIRLDADITGQVDCYLICRPAGILVTTDRVVQQLIPGTAFSFPDVWLGALPASADFYLKWVFQRRCGADPVPPAGHQRGIACTTIRSQPQGATELLPAWPRRKPACGACPSSPVRTCWLLSTAP